MIGHVLSENRIGLIVDMDLTGTSGTAERESALGMIDGAIPGRRHRTLAADAGYHARGFVEDLRDRVITPHVAMRKYVAIDVRTTRVAGYEKSSRCRRIAEGINRWVNGAGRMAKTRFKGVMRSKSALMMYGAATNLLMMSKLLAPACRGARKRGPVEARRLRSRAAKLDRLSPDPNFGGERRH